MSDFEFFTWFFIYAAFKLGMLIWLTLVFYVLPWWPDLEGDLKI